MNQSELRRIVKEEINHIIEGEDQINNSYSKIIELIRREARKLNDDDAFELHERLKDFFNRTI